MKQFMPPDFEMDKITQVLKAKSDQIDDIEKMVKQILKNQLTENNTDGRIENVD